MRRRVSTAESFGESSGASEKTESDSGFHWAMRRDLAATKDVQEAFFPPESLSIPCMARQTFYEPVHEIGGDYYDFLSLQGERWGIAIGDVSGNIRERN